MFAWFVQGLEKVMPQPVTREKQDTQVRWLLDRQRACECHVPSREGIPCPAGDTTYQCWGLLWFVLSHSSFEKTNPHDLSSWRKPGFGL